MAPGERLNEGSRDPDGRDRLQRQARALGNPTRFAIFEHMAKAGAPVRVAALVEGFGLNHNAIRQHLAKLCEAELLVEEFAPRTGPGRPALQYRLASDVAGTWGIQSGYQQLALVLLQMASQGLSAREAGRRAGREAAGGIAADPGTPIEQLISEVRRLGFVAQGVFKSPELEVVLDHCPYPAAAAVYPEIVCEIHRGLIEGFLEGLGSDLVVIGLQNGAPDGRGCILQLRGRGLALSVGRTD